MDMIRNPNYTRLYYIALVIVPAGKGPIPHLTRLYPRACGRPRLRAARRARDARAHVRDALARLFVYGVGPTDGPTDRRTDGPNRDKRHGQRKKDKRH